jgi:hypothetical protein
MSTHTEYQRCEDTCPVCDQPIDWEDGDHRLEDEFVICMPRADVYDVAVLELQHLAAR